MPEKTNAHPQDLYPGIQPERVQQLNDHSQDPDDLVGDYVLYWMQQSQRSEFNHALEYAVHRADELELPVLVAFGLMEDYPEANRRHYHFMLQGLADAAAALAARKITFVVQRGAPDEVALRLARHAALVVCDRGYLRHQRQWRDHVAEEADRPVVQVESDVVVPVELVSDKVETAARTIRPKITKHLDRFLVPVGTATPKVTELPSKIDSEQLDDIDKLLDSLKLEQQVEPVPLFQGGTTAAKQILQKFFADSWDTYAGNRMHPETSDVSHMSKYLHFGQISPVYIALEAGKHGGGENADSFLDELIIRRELPMNYVFYQPDYDTYAGLPDWAHDTLAEHEGDERRHLYTRDQLEQGETHDEYWNAAMAEMRSTGYMHNYMRMYWGKKIIEWSKSPKTAYATTLYLNNKYFLDGRDANSFANVAWVFGRHDRGWTERDIFGKVRYMNAKGLERKADPKAYVVKVAELVRSVEG
ncbi:MAG: deoxyribodipyrimidine photo-lyase [Pseudonocardiales bacterium]|nr:deoxyribodipyrimidine photo-lyase [Pseudonocardiales bacterium]